MISDLLREEIKEFKNYEVNDIECKYKMDANETPFRLPERTMEALSEIIADANVNRYPDPISRKLKRKLSEYLGVSEESIMIGNGGDELIHLIMLSFVNKNDGVVYPLPSFAMYKVYSQIAGAKQIEVSLNEDYSYDVDKFSNAIDKYNPKVIILCTPNNPTGNVMKREDIIKILQLKKGIVVVDEAYYEFDGETVVDLINKYENLIVLRTMSKAFSLAGIRVGYLAANPEIVKCLNLVKAPYNVNSVSQALALNVLESGVFKDRIEYIINERQYLYEGLKDINGIKLYPSRANFILAKFQDADYVYKSLIERGILVRNFSNSPGLCGALRITVGTREANNYLIKCLKEVLA
jgi:histidinol-phosphate aminotransferase